MDDKPVTFPPGRARPTTSPPSTGFEGFVITIGNRAGGLLRGAGGRIARRDDAVDLEADELGGKAVQPIRVPFGRPLLDGDVPSLT